MTDCEHEKARIVQQLVRQYRGSVKEGRDPDLILAQMVYDGWSVAAVEEVRKAVQDG